MRSPEANWVLVAEVGSALARSGTSLKHAPMLLRRLLMEGDWHDFTTPLGKRNRYEYFDQFAVTEPPDGLGVPLVTIERVLGDDRETLDLLDRACQRQGGGDRTTVNNVNGGPPRPEGNSSRQALRRLRKDAPAVHERVVAGELSPHAGMLEAGLRQKAVSVSLVSPESVVRALRRHLRPEDLARVIELLAEAE